MARDDRRVLFLAAKTPAGLHLHDAHLVGRQVEERPQRLVDVVRTLHRAPDRDAVGGVRRRHHAVRLDVELLLRAGFVFALDDEVGGRHRGIDVAAADQVVLEDVVAAPDDRAAVERVVHREDRWLGIDVDPHVPAGFFEHVAIRVRQQHHWLFRMVDAAVSQARLIVDDEGDAIDAGNVGGRDDDEVGPGNVRPELDAA